MIFQIGDIVKQVKGGMNTDPADNDKITTVIDTGGFYGRFSAIRINTSGFKHKTTNWRGEEAFILVERPQKDWD
jgi:hypothetical protein